MGDALLQHQLHQLLGGWRHILKALPEGNHRESHALQILHHLHSAPAVKSNLPNVEPFSQPLDELFNVAVVNHISLCSLEVALPLPYVIRHMVTADAQIDVVLRYPEVRQYGVFVLLVQRREDQYKGGNIRGAGQIQPAVANPAFQIVLRGGEGAAIPFLHRHPAHRLFDPLVQPELAEAVFLGGVLLGGLTGRFDLVDAHRDAKRGVGLLPHLGVCPVIFLIGAIDDRVEGGVDLPAFQDVLGLLVCLVADRAGIRPRRGDQKVEGLHTSVTGPLRHDIKELPVGLGMQLVKNHAVDVEAVLGVGLRREHLVEAVGGMVDNAFLRSEDLDPLGERRTHLHHVRRHLENDRSLLPVGGAAIHLGALLTVPAGEQKGHRCSQLRFAHFLGDFDVGGVELAVTVLFDHAEQVADDAFLPVNQLEGLSRPGAFGVAETLDEADGIVRQGFVVVGPLGHEGRGGVFFELSDVRHLRNEHKKTAMRGCNEEQSLPAPSL